MSARRVSAKGGHEDVKPDLEASSNLPLPSQESVRQILHKSTASLAGNYGHRQLKLWVLHLFTVADLFNFYSEARSLVTKFPIYF